MAIHISEMDKKTGRLPAFPSSRKVPAINHSTEQDRHLAGLSLAHEAVGGIRREFITRRVVIDEQLSAGDLGPAGHAKALRALAAELKQRIEGNLQPKVTAARAYTAALRAELLAPAAAPADDLAVMLDASLRRDRVIRRFEAADATAKAGMLLQARQSADGVTLQCLLGEPGLISDERLREALAADVMRARGAKTGTYSQYAELCGALDVQGNHDPTLSPIDVTSYALGSTVEWLDAQAPPEPVIREGEAVTYRGLNGAPPDEPAAGPEPEPEPQKGLAYGGLAGK